MTKKILINYADLKYKKTQRFNSWTGKYIGGFDKVIEYGPDDIDPDFKEKNAEILSTPRGNGGWLWKPYFIYTTLEKMETDSYLFYCDSGSFFCNKVENIIKSMADTCIWVSDLPLIEKQWTKQIVFEVLNADTKEVKDTHHIQASFICIRKTTSSVLFVKKWLELCERPDLLLAFSENEYQGECISHREDQSILSVLCKINGIKTHRDPSQYGRVPEKYYEKGRLFKIPQHNDAYPVTIILHRSRNMKLKILLCQWSYSWLPISFLRWYMRKTVNQ